MTSRGKTASNDVNHFQWSSTGGRSFPGSEIRVYSNEMRPKSVMSRGDTTPNLGYPLGLL